MTIEFADHADAHRYELRDGDTVLCSIDYRLHGEVITMIHTEVGDQYSGQGHAATLARSALDAARSRGLSVVPSCPYVAAYIGKHPEYADLVAAP